MAEILPIQRKTLYSQSTNHDLDIIISFGITSEMLLGMNKVLPYRHLLTIP